MKKCGNCGRPVESDTPKACAVCYNPDDDGYTARVRADLEYFKTLPPGATGPSGPDRSN